MLKRVSLFISGILSSLSDKNSPLPCCVGHSSKWHGCFRRRGSNNHHITSKFSNRRVDVRRVSFWSIVIIFSIALSYKNSPLSCRTIHREEVAWSGDGGAATATDVEGFSVVHASPSKALEGFGWIGMVGGAVDVLVAAKDNITTNLNHSVLIALTNP